MSACGTRSAYTSGCRCEQCREANRVYQRERRFALVSRLGTPWEDAEHGHPEGYNSHNCRCDRCVAAVRGRGNRARAARREAFAAGRIEVEHGSYSTYTGYGCRCDACRGAWAAYCRDWRKKAYR